MAAFNAAFLAAAFIAFLDLPAAFALEAAFLAAAFTAFLAALTTAFTLAAAAFLDRPYFLAVAIAFALAF